MKARFETDERGMVDRTRGCFELDDPRSSPQLADETTPSSALFNLLCRWAQMAMQDIETLAAKVVAMAEQEASVRGELDKHREYSLALQYQLAGRNGDIEGHVRMITDANVQKNTARLDALEASNPEAAPNEPEWPQAQMVGVEMPEWGCNVLLESILPEGGRVLRLASIKGGQWKANGMVLPYQYKPYRWWPLPE